MAEVRHQGSLFADAASPVDIADGAMTYRPGWMSAADADRLFHAIVETSAWRQEVIRMYGREVPVPRITAWHADPGLAYRYSGIEHQPQAWTDALLEIKVRAEREADQSFNSVLVNRYRDGRDGVAWHSDDEPELGPAPIIASVSLGATRRFHVRRRGAATDRHDLDRHDLDRHDLDLEHGGLLLMHAGAQAVWEHQIPKTSRPVGTRVNLTFRDIITPT